MSKRSLMPAKVYYESGIAAAEAGMERKQIAGLESWSSASRQDGSNFRSNMVTLAEYQDSGAVGSAGVLGLAAAWACVNLLAGTIASLPLMVYRTGRDGRRNVATDHPLYRVLHDSPNADQTAVDFRSEEHTSELQSLMRISYAVFCLKKKKQKSTMHIQAQRIEANE